MPESYIPCELETYIGVMVETWDGRDNEDVYRDVIELLRRNGFRVKSGRLLDFEEGQLINL